MKRLYTIGYRGLTYPRLLEELRRHQVHGLLDVRAVPWSQDPLYRARELAAYLAGNGIDYLDGRAWGNPYRHAPDLEPFRLHLQEHHDLVERLGITLRADDRTVCLLCQCPAAARCHRGVICSALQERFPGDFDVIHLPQKEVVPPPRQPLDLAPLPGIDGIPGVYTTQPDFPWSEQ